MSTHPYAVCGQWEYKNHADYGTLPKLCDDVFEHARSDSTYVDDFLKDTRQAHTDLFSTLTLPGQEYLAGHYRGAVFECLKFRPVMLGLLPQGSVIHMGHAPDEVQAAMDDLHTDLQDAMNIMEAEQAKIGTELTRRQYLMFISAIFADYLQFVFTIHPYANGNGHIGRMLVAIGLLKLKVRPRKWTLDARPPYDTAVQMHRWGYPEDLTILILDAIAEPVAQV